MYYYYKVNIGSYRERYFPSWLTDITEADFLSSLLCPILFHELMSQTAVRDLSPAQN
jgi:hypothetical protein